MALFQVIDGAISKGERVMKIPKYVWICNKQNTHSVMIKSELKHCRWLNLFFAKKLCCYNKYQKCNAKRYELVANPKQTGR